MSFSYDDLDDIINSAAMPGGGTVGDMDFSGYFTGGGENFDFGSLDSSAFSYDDLDAMLNDAALGIGDFNFDTSNFEIDPRRVSLPDLDFGSNFDLGSFEDLAGVDAVNTAAENAANFDDFIQRYSQDSDEAIPLGDTEYGKNLDVKNLEKGFDYETARQAEYQRYLDSLTSDDAGLELGAGSGVQDFGSSVDMDKSMGDFDAAMTDIMQNRGGFTSQWQQVGTDRIMVRDDGTGIGINENGDSYALSVKDVGTMIKNGQLNTFGSGYNTATGGNKIAPGGGSSVVLNNGKTGQLLTNGKVIDTTTGKVIGTTTDVKKVVTTDGDGKKIVKDQEKTTSTTPRTPTTPKLPAVKKDNNMILALLALLALMNRGGGGGGGQSATIPSLSADRRQLPYGPAAGSTARPGAGGTTYFSPTTYTRKAAGGGMMYGGGGISNLGGYSDGGRLLKGPGDGVSDSIPATIGGKQPARLATGEFVVPARIVSELGNGSTEAGAKKLYAMMDRVQKARRKTKNVAADTKAHKYLPA